MFSLYIGVGIYFIVLLLGSPRPANDNNSVVRAFCLVIYHHSYGTNVIKTNKNILIMLKKSFSILAAFILGLIISWSIIACADDISDYSNEKDTLETLAERVAYLEKEVQTLKKASVAQNIGSISYIYDGESGYVEFSYDESGRLTQATSNYFDNNFTCSYNKNVCTFTGGDDTFKFTLTDEESQDFHKIQSIIQGILTCDMW